MISCESDIFIISSYISSADFISTLFIKSGTNSSDGPITKVTLAPLYAAIFAISTPIFPVELFEIYLTGSIASLVGPALTQTFFPAKSFSLYNAFLMYSKSTSGSGIFPAPLSPHARYPLAGKITSMP